MIVLNNAFDSSIRFWNDSEVYFTGLRLLDSEHYLVVWLK